MKSPSTAALLSIVHLRDGLHPIELNFPVADCPELVEAGAVGEAYLRGKADASPGRIWLDLILSVKVIANCSRSLEDFELELEAPLKVLVLRETRHDIEWDYDGEEEYVAKVPDTQRELDIGEVLRQSIELERPLNPVKPGIDLPPGVELEDVPIPKTVDEDEPPTDPRWDALRKLRKP